MAETYGFYDTEELVDGSYDREYVAQQWADYFKLFIGTGVFASPTNQLKVVAGEGMNIIVKEGWAFIEGRWYHNDADLVIPVQPNTTVSTITSGVFIQADSSDRVIKAVIATGRTTPDREAPVYELELAQIQVATGTTAITDSMITDMRTDESVCGFVKGLLEGVIPTADLFLQFETQFMDWFDGIKDQLSEDAAGHLQEEIEDLQEVSYTSGDTTLNPTTSVSVPLLASEETAPSRWAKVSNMFKNIRYLLNSLTAEDGLEFKFRKDANGKRGYLDENGDFCPFSSGAVKIGTYSSNTTIDVSAYSPTSVNQFVAVAKANSGNVTYGDNLSEARGLQLTFTPPSLSLSDNQLSVTMGNVYGRIYDWWGGTRGTHSIWVTCDVYYVGDADSAS